MTTGFGAATVNVGELLRSRLPLRSGSMTELRTGDEGKASSTGFRGVRTRLGEPDGLPGRSDGGNSMWPDPLTPGIDCVRDMGKPTLAADLDLAWPDKGEVVLGR